MAMTLANMETQIMTFSLEEQIRFMAYLANIIQQKSELKYSESTQKITKKPIRHLGKWKGQIWMADDFDETPECFEEYM